MGYTLLYDKGAFYDGIRPDQDALLALAKHFTIIDFTQNIPEDTQVFINLHGKYFPKRLWSQLSSRLDSGMAYISLSNGSPLSNPVRVQDGTFIKERHQTCYHRKFFIENAVDISAEYQKRLEINNDLPLLKGFEDAFEIGDTQGYIVQFTHQEDHPGKCGSSGPIDATIFPLLKAYDSKNRQTAAPVTLIEYYRGDMAGSRHIFINQNASERFWKNGGCNLLKHLADYANSGAFRFYIQTDYALYYEAERPMLQLRYEHFKSNKTGRVTITVKKNSWQVFSLSKDIQFTEMETFENIPMHIDITGGLYTIECVLLVDDCVHIYRNGFWGRDGNLLKNTSKITCNRDYFLKNGEVMPVVGMTYHQSDLHRKYLFLPNPYLWDRDFRDMKQAGINMVRTGNWTAFRQIMFIDGHPNEAVLRAFEAFVHTACYYDMPLVFCFFTFTPEQWEGENCYLDKTALRAQKRYITAFTERTENCSLVSWDLINEPSVSNPDRLWSTRPSSDRHELKEWREFLKKRHGSISDLQEKWNVTPDQAPAFDCISLPDESCFNDNPCCFSRVNGFPGYDYHHFAYRVFNDWIDEMRRCIRAGNNSLITVGQDETLPGKKPHALLYQDHVDYVCNHSWWLMDGLYHDGIFSKPESRPCLIQETGIMYVANADSTNRRNFEQARNVLERKYGLAFGAGCAGAVHWIWNTNCYMNDINEVHIGGILADGSHKAETEVSYHFGGFIKKTGKLFRNRTPERIAVVMPFSTHFSSRNYADRFLVSLTRMFGYDLHMGFQVLSEYELNPSMDYDVIFIPSPRILTSTAFDAAVELAEKGATVVISGVYFQDEYFKTVSERIKLLNTSDMVVNAEREERLVIDGKTYFAGYGGDSLAIIDKVRTDDGVNVLKEIQMKKGRLIWANIPIEVSGNYDIVKAFYRYALETKGIQPVISWNTEKQNGVFMRKLSFENNDLYVIVSENGSDCCIDFKDNEINRSFRFYLESGRIAIFMTDKTGNLIDSYRNMPIEVYECKQ